MTGHYDYNDGDDLI